MAAPTRTTIQLRRDTRANWETNNPSLVAGEIGIDTSTGKFKIGTGAAWNSTDYGPAGLTYASASSTLINVNNATHIAGGAAGKVLYQTGSGATDFTTVGSSGQLLSSNGTSAPTWFLPRLDQLASTTAAQFRSIISGVTSVTGTAGNVVFSGSPTITSPTIVTSVTLNGAISGAVTITATDTYTTSVAFPTYSGTLTTEGNVTTNFLSKTSSTAQTMSSDVDFQSHSISGVTTLTATSTVILSGIAGLSNSYGVMKAATNGTVTDGNYVVLGSGSSTSNDVQGTLPLANGGTGGTDVTTARQGLRVYVQSAQPSSANVTNYSPQVGDLWFW